MATAATNRSRRKPTPSRSRPVGPARSPASTSRGARAIRTTRQAFRTRLPATALVRAFPTLTGRDGHSGRRLPLRIHHHRARAGQRVGDHQERLMIRRWAAQAPPTPATGRARHELDALLSAPDCGVELAEAETPARAGASSSPPPPHSITPSPCGPSPVPLPLIVVLMTLADALVPVATPAPLRMTVELASEGGQPADRR